MSSNDHVGAMFGSREVSPTTTYNTRYSGPQRHIRISYDSTVFNIPERVYDLTSKVRVEIFNGFVHLIFTQTSADEQHVMLDDSNHYGQVKFVEEALNYLHEQIQGSNKYRAKYNIPLPGLKAAPKTTPESNPQLELF